MLNLYPMDVDTTFRKCIRIQKQNPVENFVLLQVFMITTSRAIALFFGQILSQLISLNYNFKFYENKR